MIVMTHLGDDRDGSDDSDDSDGSDDSDDDRYTPSAERQ